MKSSGEASEIWEGLELKYCERCGGLWLRPSGGAQIYCSVCARAMADLPPSSRDAEVPVSRPRTRKKQRKDGPFEVHEESTSTDFDGRMA
jgi:Zn-finger nucleic acid-binding protein